MNSGPSENPEHPSPMDTGEPQPQTGGTTDAAAASASPVDETGCPAPLFAKDVFEAFRDESDHWTLDRGGYQIQGRTWGAGPPLYLLGGIGGTHALYAFLVWTLREKFRCVAFDYPARVPRRPGDAAATAQDLADDLFAVADAHGDRTFPLFATSFGGIVAMTAMLERPERVERAVLQGGFAYRQLSRLERLLIRASAHVPGTCRRVPLRRRIERHNHFSWFPSFDRSRWDFYIENTGIVKIAALAERSAIVRDTDLRPRLDDITQPVLLVHAEGDGGILEQCHAELAAGIPDVQTEWLQNCGQMPALSHPHRLAKIIQSFVLGEDEADANKTGTIETTAAQQSP